MNSPFSQRRWKLALAAGIGGLALCLVAALVGDRVVFQSYLSAYLFWLGISLGSMAILMLHQLTGGRWGHLIGAPLTAATRLLPLLALLFIPLLFGLHDLYAWSRADEIARDAIVQRKEWYLNPTFFMIRAAIYFAVWSALGRLLTSAAAVETSRRQRLSAGGLILYGFSVSFAAFDWLMSLTPHWYSTTFGLLVGTGQMLAAMAFAIIAAALLSSDQPAERFHDLGNLLLMFVMTWAYLAFTQYLIVWMENLPHEVEWYVPRAETGWRWIGLLLIVFHFAAPFFVLLFRSAKRAPYALAATAAVLLLAHLIDAFWLVVPPFRAHGIGIAWTDFAAVIGIGGIWLAAFAKALQVSPINEFIEAVEHG